METNAGHSAPHARETAPRGRDVDPASIAGLNLIARDLAGRLDAEAVLLVIGHAEDELVPVLASAGAAPVLGELAVAQCDFLPRILTAGPPVLGAVDAIHDHSFGQPTGKAWISHAVGAPVEVPGGPAGALYAGLNSPLPSDRAGLLWALESYARMASLCLYDGSILGEWLSAARLDGLTGCLNHDATHQQLERELRRAERHDHPICCGFLDLDDFKEINTDYGHVHGSRVLADVGAVLRKGVRRYDTVGRYGGDEFIVLFPGIGERVAEVLAERLRAAVAAETHNGDHHRLDVSIGIAQWQPGTSAEELLLTADRALRAAKEAGGATVVSAGALVSHESIGAASLAGHPRTRRIRTGPPGRTAADPGSPRA